MLLADERQLCCISGDKGTIIFLIASNRSLFFINNNIPKIVLLRINVYLCTIQINDKAKNNEEKPYASGSHTLRVNGHGPAPMDPAGLS